MIKARDTEWRKKEPSLKEVQKKYSDLPKDWILKADMQRRGLDYTQKAIDRIDPSIHATNQSSGELLRANKDYIPTGLIMKDGSYLVMCNFDYDTNAPQRDPYIIDEVDGKLVVVDQDEILLEIQDYWEKPDFYDVKASNGVPMGTYVQARPQRLDITAASYCHFWDKPGEGCKYCPMSPNYKLSGRKEECYNLKYYGEAIKEALKEEGRNTSILITGGSILSGKEVLDDELELYINLLKEIGQNFEGRFPSQLISSAFNKRQLQRLYDETGLLTYTTDIEVLNKELFEWICVGKANHIGYEEWKKRLYDAVEVFGEGNVTSGVVLGVELAKPKGFQSEDEAFHAIIQEAEEIISHGVALAANIWRPAPRSILQNQDTPSLDYFIRSYREFNRLQKKYIKNPYTDDFRRCGAHVGLDLMRTY